MITQHYMIDLIPAGDPVVVHVSQYDKLARILAFDLYTGGVAFEPPAGATAQIRGTKPDGTIFNYAMTVDGITVSIPIQQQMALVAGDVPCEIQIVGDGGAQIGTANFLLKVERSALDEEAAESSSDIPLFEQLTQQAMEAASDAEASAEDAQAAQSAAESLIPASGTVGQVLTKTATGTAWEDAHGGDVQTVDGFEPDTNGAVTTERVLTQAQYNALSESEKNNGMTYYISDGEGGGGGSTTASQVSYSNTQSGLSATNVQGAIDELRTLQLGSLAIVSGTLSSATGWGDYTAFPTGFNSTNSCIIGWEVLYYNVWRTGIGFVEESRPTRFMVGYDTNGVRAYNNDAQLYGAQYRAVLYKYQ